MITKNTSTTATLTQAAGQIKSGHPNPLHVQQFFFLHIFFFIENVLNPPKKGLPFLQNNHHSLSQH